MRKLFHRLPALLAAAAICLSFLPAGIAQAEENSAAEQFEDVLPGQWYASAIEFVVENGYFNGVSEKSFAPDAPMTRAMFVTVLGRYAGVEDTAQEASDSVFIDVEPGSYYSGYAFGFASFYGSNARSNRGTAIGFRSAFVRLPTA